MAHRETEQFRVLYLDRKNVLIADEAQAQGTVDHVPVYPREVSKRALEMNVSAIIVVHNHLSGDPTPSTQDDESTQQLLAHVPVSKYVGHFPLNRKSQIHARECIDLDRSTISDWVGRSTESHFEAT